MVLDPTSNIGKLRLRVADYSSLPVFPDSVYQSVLDENDDNLPKSAVIMAQYILGTLTMKTHRKMAQLEVWGSDAFKQYKEFLILTTKDPAFMWISPIPYGASGTELHPLLQFSQDWNKNYAVTQSQQLAHDAYLSVNDGSLYGVLGDV